MLEILQAFISTWNIAEYMERKYFPFNQIDTTHSYTLAIKFWWQIWNQRKREEETRKKSIKIIIMD